MSQNDIIIIGDGVIALSTALALHFEDPRLKIEIVGDRRREGAASTAAGAMINCFGEATQSIFHSDLSMKKFEHAFEALKLWDDWLERIADMSGKAERPSINWGTFIFLNTRGSGLDDEGFDAIVAALEHYQQPWEDVDPREIEGLQPTPLARPLKALFTPVDGSLDSGTLITSLEQACDRTDRITWAEKSARSLKTGAGGSLQVELIDGTVREAARILVAAGAGSQAILDTVPDIARRMPRQFSGGGVAITVDTSPQFMEEAVSAGIINRHAMRTPNRAFACGLHQVPLGGNRAYIGATNWAVRTPTSKPNLADTQFVFECATEQINQDYVWAGIEALHFGNRPMTIDTFPLIGETSREGLWVLTGTFRDGLTCSPLFAQQVARGMLDSDRRAFAPEFAPEREPLSIWSRDDIVMQVCKHMEAAVYEHQVINGSKFGYHSIFDKMLIEEVLAFYDDIESDYVLPPELFPLFGPSKEKSLPFLNDYYGQISSAWQAA